MLPSRIILPCLLRFSSTVISVGSGFAFGSGRDGVFAEDHRECSKACGSLYCCRFEGPEKDKRENKTYQNVKGTAPDEIFYRSG